jgi:hypothetical protein
MQFLVDTTACIAGGNIERGIVSQQSFKGTITQIYGIQGSNMLENEGASQGKQKTLLQKKRNLTSP